MKVQNSLGQGLWRLLLLSKLLHKQNCKLFIKHACVTKELLNFANIVLCLIAKIKSVITALKYT